MNRPCCVDVEETASLCLKVPFKTALQRSLQHVLTPDILGAAVEVEVVAWVVTKSCSDRGLWARVLRPCGRPRVRCVATPARTDGRCTRNLLQHTLVLCVHASCWSADLKISSLPVSRPWTEMVQKQNAPCPPHAHVTQVEEIFTAPGGNCRELNEVNSTSDP